MKKSYLFILLIGLLLPGNSWGSECVGFENMAVKILRQEGKKVYLAWNASVTNKCNQMVSAKIQMKLVDKADNSLGNSFQRINQLLPNETIKIQNEKSLLSEIYFKVQGYYFIANEFSTFSE
jgi:hypothetical protein